MAANNASSNSKCNFAQNRYKTVLSSRFSCVLLKGKSSTFFISGIAERVSKIRNKIEELFIAIVATDL